MVMGCKCKLCGTFTAITDVDDWTMYGKPLREVMYVVAEHYSQEPPKTETGTCPACGASGGWYKHCTVCGTLKPEGSGS